MIFEVEMTMFQDGIIRNVEVPDSELSGTEKDLDLIFHYGQNDFQPDRQRVSVSAGDVIRLRGKRYLILFLGYEELKENEKPLTDKNELLRRIMSEHKSTKHI